MGGQRPRGRKGDTDAWPGIRPEKPRSSTGAQSSVRLVAFIALVVHSTTSTREHFFVIYQCPRNACTPHFRHR